MTPPAATNSNYTSSSETRERYCTGIICLLLFAVALLSGSAYGIIKGDVLQRNKNPEFRIDYVSISPFNNDAQPSNSQTSSPSYNNWNIMNISFVAKNPKSMKRLSYDRVSASLFYGDKLVSITGINGFHQNPKEQTVIDARFITSYEMSPVDIGVAASIDEYMKQGRVLEFNVLLQAMVDFGGLKHRWMKVNCGDIKVQFFSDTTFFGGTKPAIAKAIICHVLL